MKASVIESYGKKVIYKENFPNPKVLPNEVLIHVKAASVNPIDWKVALGKVKILLNYKMPLILGNDGSGVISEIGSDIKKFKVGDEVYFRPGKQIQKGTFAEYISVVENEVALKPQNLSFEEAASIPLVGLTSMQAISDLGKISKGSKVFIHAGSGGVGSFAIQYAKTLDAFVATTCSTRNIELVKSIGADKVIDYTKENFETLEKDYDFVFDTMGGEIKNKSFSILKKDGLIVSIADIPTPDIADDFSLNPIVKFLFYILNTKNRSLVKKFNVNYKYLFMNASGEQLTQIAKLIEEKKIKPIIDKVFNLTEVDKAFEYQQTGRARGKIIIKIN